MEFSIISHAGVYKKGSNAETEIQISLHEVKLAEDLGYDAWWHTEHHLSPYGLGGIFSMLGAAAQITKRIRIGSLVILSPLYHPLNIASHLAVLDIMSEGRLNAGLGRGYRPHTMEALSKYKMSEMRAVHEETVEIVKKAWQGEFSHQGSHYEFENENINLRPLQKASDILWQPVLSPESFEWCLKNEVNAVVGAHLVPDQVTEQYWKNWRAMKQAFPEAKIKAANQQFVYVAPTKAEAERDFAAIAPLCVAFRADLPADYSGSVWDAYRKDLLFLSENTDEATRRSIVGDPETVIERLNFFKEQGVEHLIVNTRQLDLPQEKIDRSMKLFAEKVMPHFKN